MESLTWGSSRRRGAEVMLVRHGFCSSCSTRTGRPGYLPDSAPDWVQRSQANQGIKRSQPASRTSANRILETRLSCFARSSMPVTEATLRPPIFLILVFCPPYKEGEQRTFSLQQVSTANPETSTETSPDSSADC